MGGDAALVQALLNGAMHRWGPRALQRGSDVAAASQARPTGLSALDTCLGGGLPLGSVTLLCGSLSAGATTLLFCVVNQAMQDGARVLLVDPGCTFDAAYAAACGVPLEHLPLARPPDARSTWQLLDAALQRRAFDVMVLLDHAQVAPLRLRSPTAQRLLRNLTHTRTSLLVRASLGEAQAAQQHPLAPVATLQLDITPCAWLLNDAQPQLCTRITVVRQRGRPSGDCVELILPVPLDDVL